jgi:hypothetical protein
VSLARGSARWARRAILAVVLAGAAVIPGHAPGSASAGCARQRCGLAGKVLWTRVLPGSWTVSDSGGTAATRGQAFLAEGGQVAAIGFGLTVTGYDLRTGAWLWTTALSGFPARASIVSVRAWPGAVTAGVSVPRARRGPVRREVVLRARTGTRVRAYPAAEYGGAVAASSAATVIVGPAAVTSYDNTTGRIRWRRRTGRLQQAWRVDGGDLYVTISAGGYLGTAPVTALRQISLRTGAQRVIRPHGRSFAGTLSGAFDGVVLFSGPLGVTAYSGSTGQRLWARAGAIPQSADQVRGRLYLTRGAALLGVDPVTGARRSVTPGASGLYEVRDGIAIGLDQGAGGDAWGYDVTSQRVVWTASRLPWPHYFVDLSGIGGSASPASGTMLITSCASLGARQHAAAGPAGSAAAAGQPAQAGQACLRPELVALDR